MAKLYDSQIKNRIKEDQLAILDSFQEAEDALTGKRILDLIDRDEFMRKKFSVEILHYFDIDFTANEINTMPFSELLEVKIASAGIMKRIVRLDEDWYKTGFVSYVGILKEDQNPVIILHRPLIGYLYFDMKREKWYRVRKSNADIFEDEAISFYPSLMQDKCSFMDIVKIVLKRVRLSNLFFVVASLLLSVLVGMILPNIQYYVFNNLVFQDNIRLIVSVMLLLLNVMIIKNVFEYLSSIFTSRISKLASVYVEAATMSRLLSVPVNFFKKYSSGELYNNVGYLSTMVSEFFTSVFSASITSIFSLLYIFQMFNFAPSLVVPGIIIVLASTILQIFSILARIKISRKYMKAASKEQGLSFAILKGISKLKLAGAEKRIFLVWSKVYSKVAKYLYNPPLFVKISTPLLTGISLIGTVVIYFYSVTNGITIGEYFAFNSAYSLVVGAFTGINTVVASIARFKPMYELAKPLLETSPEFSPDTPDIDNFKGNIEISNLCFSYESGLHKVFDNLNLKIKNGEYLAVVGESGCGKSTLVRLLLGFEKPDAGNIFYDSKDLESVNVKSIRKNIGSVLQDGCLFQGDILSNILVSYPQLELEDAWEAARLAQMDKEIQEMPMGMYTMISEEGGGGVSGGQKQRILIARALVGDPKLLIFDEATSAVDNVTQKKISDALGKLNCTRIVVAHRLSTIKNCDRIILIKDGTIAEEGTYDDLIAKNGAFAELVEHQRLD